MIKTKVFAYKGRPWFFCLLFAIKCNKMPYIYY